MFCSNCGKKIEDNANFCRYCGQKVIPEVDKSEQQNIMSHSARDEQNHEEDDVVVFVGKNNSYYKRKWSTMKPNGISWNFAAFFLSIFWLGYRKMYRNILFIALAFLAIDVLLYLVNYQYSDQFMDPIDRFIGTGMAVFVGLYGNHLYKRHTENKLIAIQSLPIEQASKNNLLKKKGGRSWLGIVLGLLIFFGVYGIPSSFIPFGTDSVEVDSYESIHNSTPNPVLNETDSMTMIEQIAMESVGIPYDHGTYEQKVIMLMSFYMGRIDEFHDRTEQLQNDPITLTDTIWLEGIYNDLSYMDGIMESIMEIDDVPREHENSHSYLIEFAYASYDMSMYYRQTIDLRDEALFGQTIAEYERAGELLTQYALLLEEELQKKYY